MNAADLRLAEATTVSLTGHAGSADQLAMGFCYGTPLRMAIQQRGDLDATAAIVSTAMTARLGHGNVSGSLTAHIVRAERGPGLAASNDHTSP